MIETPSKPYNDAELILDSLGVNLIPRVGKPSFRGPTPERKKAGKAAGAYGRGLRKYWNRLNRERLERGAKHA